MRGAGAAGAGLGAGAAGLTAIFAPVWERAEPSRWCCADVIRPYPAAPDATRRPATADAVISDRHERRRARPSRRPGGASRRPGPGGAGSRLGSIADWAAVTPARSSAAVGRPPGSLARHRSISGRTPAGAPLRSAVPPTTRSSTAAGGPVPNGLRPVAAKASTAPRLKTSLSGPTSWPWACSGDMKLGVPTTRPARPSGVASAAWEIPKSITRGPSRASSTLDGLRSPCTTPAAWIAVRLLARPVASDSRAPAVSGPRLLTVSDSDGAATYEVASQGTGASTSASTTSAVNRPLTFRAAATSLPNRARNSGSAASSAWTIFTATGRPAADMPRNTRPMPPAPRRPSSW